MFGLPVSRPFVFQALSVLALLLAGGFLARMCCCRRPTPARSPVFDAHLFACFCSGTGVLQVDGCVFRDLAPADAAGAAAVSVSGGSNATFTRCVFADNTGPLRTESDC